MWAPQKAEHCTKAYREQVEKIYLDGTGKNIDIDYNRLLCLFCHIWMLL